MGQESKVLAAESKFEMTPGGSIRIVEPYGLRFQVRMSADVKEKATEVGMLIFPADYLENNGTDGDVYYESVEELAKTNQTSHRIKLNLTSKLYEKDGYWYGNGAIVNIKGKNMTRKFTAIAYYVDDDNTTVWADTTRLTNTTRSASQIALLAHADKTTTYQAETDKLLLKYVGYTKDSDLKDVKIGAIPLFVDNGDNVAKSYWSAEYVDGGVKVMIDVKDTISIDANDLGYSDNVEIQMQAVDNHWKTKGATLNFLCDASGRTWSRCWNGYGYDAIELVAEDYNCNFNATETGYQVELFVSYRALNSTEAEAKGNVRICPMLRNRSDAGNNASLTSELLGCNWFSTKSWLVLNADNKFIHSYSEEFTLASKNAEASNILKNMATLRADNGGKMMKTEMGNQAHMDSSWCIDGLASDLIGTNYVFMGLDGRATVMTKGNVVICISDDNVALASQFVDNGWNLLATKCRAAMGINGGFDGALSSTTSYYYKYCNEGETIATSGVYSLVFGKGAIKKSDLVYETMSAYHSFSAVNKDYYKEINNTMNGMPSVAVTNGGRIYTIYMTGADGEYQMKNSGVLKYSDDNGKTWSNLFVIDTWNSQKINSTKQIVASDFELKVDPNTNVLYVTYTTRPNANGVVPMDTQTWMFTVSNPDSQDMSEDVLDISKHWNTELGYVRNGFTVLKNGDFIIVPDETKQSAKSPVYISKDKGQTWDVLGQIYMPQATSFDESVIVERKDGSLMCFACTQTGFLCTSSSYDGGKTWSVGKLTDIPNPTSRFAVTCLASGNLVMVSNNNSSNRIGMVVSISKDNGNTWEDKICLFDGYASYPTVALDQSTGKERIHIVFDDGRYYYGQWRTGVEEGTKYEYYAGIYHDILTEEEILAGGDPNADELELLFVGDSYTDRPWCLGFDNALGTYGADTIGIGGTEVYQWNNETKLAEVVAKNPKNLFINIGINNIGNAREDGETTGNQVVAYLEALKEALPNTEIYYNMLVYPTTGWHDYNSITVSNAIVEAYIDGDTKDNVHKIDIRDDIKRCGEADGAKFNDGLHMSAPGYTILFDKLKKEIGMGRSADELNIVSSIGQEVSKYNWTKWEDCMVQSSAPTRYNVRGYAADDGLYFNAVQYVDNIVSTGDVWREQTHLEMEMWQWNGVGSNTGFVYGAFWLDGSYYLVNSDNVFPYGVTFVKNNVTITDRGENYTDGYRYKVSYEVYIQFKNNLENPNDGPYAYVHFRHHMPNETGEGFEQAVLERRDNERDLWRDEYSSYEFRKVGIIRRDGLSKFETNLEQWNALQNTWIPTEKGYYSYSMGDTFAMSQTSATNFIYEADALFAENKGAASLVFRSADAPYEGSYVANIDKSQGLIRVFKFPGGVNIGTAPLKENKKDYHLRVEVVGDLIKFYVDGELAVTGNDATFATGKLGLLTWYSTVIYQNVTYREITSDDVLALDNLKVTGGDAEMAPSYSKNVASYNVFMPGGTDEINVLATAGNGAELTYVLKNDSGVVYDKGNMESGTKQKITPSYGVSTMVIKMKKGDMASSMTLKITNKSDASVMAAEDYRPQLHFSPEMNFMNDPNGLVYDPSNGTWHMFFQYSPQVENMGSQTWGHAVSDDLVNWVELPVALEMDDFGAVFSGSCVVDENNTSGFFTDNKEGESKLVAMYTSWGATATQNIAYSKDHGMTWTKYRPAAGQPVIVDNYHDGIRDPKIFKVPGDEKDLWYMVIAGGRGRIFVSENLREWTLIQELTYADGSELHSECPELYPLEVLDKDGNATGTTKWVYSASSEFYIVGDMVKGDDGYYRFRAEVRIDSQTGGASNAYAAQSYYNDPSGRRISVHWMMDWSAPWTIAAKRWNGVQSFPLETSLKMINGGYVVTQTPVDEVKQLRGDILFNKKNVTVSEGADNILAGVTGQIYEIEAIFSNFADAKEFGFELRTGNGQKTVYKYNVEREVVTLDKSLSGVYDNDVLSWSLTPRSDGTVKLRAIVDKSVIETFANDGDAHLIDLLFADESSVGMSFYTEGGDVTIDEITVYDMKSIYTGESVTASEDEIIISLDAKERVKKNVYFTVTANIFPINKLESVEWIIPEGVTKISETNHSVTLQANQDGNCIIAARINGEYASTSVEVTDSAEEILKGDLDGNGKIEQADLDLLQEFVSGTTTPEDWQKTAGDMDGDGELTVADILKLEQIVDVTKLSYVDVANGLTDLSALAKVVESGEKSWESSAYDKASRYNEETGKYEGWFADSDWGYDSPSNGDGGIIAAEMEGPGVLTRIWSASPSNGHVKIWVDGKVVIDMPFKDLFGTGSFPFNLSELCYFAGRGANCYVPITYNESCKVVLYEGWGQYFQINYLTYGENTKVEPFELPLTSKGITALNSANDKLSGDLSVIAEDGTEIKETVTVKAGQSVDLLNAEGSAAITNMTIKIHDLDMTVGTDGVAHDWKALADLAISMKWDEEQTESVWAPLGGFFASQTGLNEYSSIASGVKEDGTMYSNWYMPYEKGAVVTITNDGDEDYSITYTIKREELEPEKAAEQLRFHAKWMRASDPVFENNDRWPDTPFLELKGSGRYVGTSLHVYKPIGYGDGLGNGLTSYNPVNGKTEAIYPSDWWWGEGDEKFFVDGEKFPSWFGTGVEDYFGYAWGTWTPFTQAYHSQPFTNGGMWGTGNRLNNRFHVLDNVPFEESLDACLEKYHRDEYATWAFTNFFYLDHSKAYTDPYGPVSLAERTAYYEDPYPAALAFDANGTAFVEGEYLAIVDATGMCQAKQQNMSAFGEGVWSNNEQVVFIAHGTDNSVRFYLNIAEEGDYDLSAAFTKAGDFGIYQHYIDGKPVGGNIDLYINDIWGNYVGKTSEIYMGYAHLTSGIHVLEAKCVGKNNQSAGYVYGMDYLKVSKASTSHFYEAEDLTITNGTATYGFQGGMDVCSQTRQFLQINNGVGDFVEFNVYINKDGYYDISAALTKAGDFSIVQHYMDGEKLGPAVDLYHGYYINPGETSLGHVYLTKGTHSIKAVVVGKNELSTGYVYGVDYFRVSEVETNGQIELQMTTNYFQNVGNGRYTLTSNSDDESKVDDAMYASHTLHTAYYSVKGKVTVDPSEDWAQARILVSDDAKNEHVFAIERVDGTNYQIFTMSKNNEDWWNDWRLISSSLINGNKNSIDFEVIAIGAKVYFLMNDEICYSSDRVNMEESTVKFSSYKNATTTVEGLQGQIFLRAEDAEAYLATKTEKAYASGYQAQINDRYNKYFVEQDCTGKGGTLILGHSHMDPVFFANWQIQMGLTDYVDGYNVGIGGTTTKDWLYAYDKLVKPFNADRFIISVGENDVCVWGSDGDEVVARLKELFEMIHADHPDAEIYYIYSLPAATKYVNGQWLDAQYKALVDGEKALCESLDYVQGIDTFNVLVDANTGNAKTELFGANNDIHLNSDGYLLWSDYLYGEIFGGEQSFNTNLTGWSALGGNWTVTRRGLGATNSGFGDQFYMSTTSLSAKQSWAFEADIVLEQGVAGGLIFGAKDPANPTRYLFGVNSNKSEGQFKHYKGGEGVQGWYEGIAHGELANTNAYHFRVEYDVKKALITYKMAPYGTENYVVTQTWPEAELATYDGQIYFGLVTFFGTVTFDNVMLDPLYPEVLIFDENNNAVVEAEHLAIAGFSGGTNQIVQGDMSSFGEGVWSNNEQLAYLANGTDNYVRFYLNIADEGDYDLSAAFTKFSDFGIYQHYIDGEPVGGNIDLYINDIWGNYALRTSEIYIGYAHLTPGIHVLEAKCVGKNNQSAGYVYGMDYLKVSKASTSHFYEAEDLTITNGTATYGFQGGMDVCSQTRQFLQINNGVGDFVEFNVYINKDGYYDISAALTKAGDFSIVQHYIDGEKLGPAVDLYHSYYINPGETSLGHVYLTKGTHSIKAVMVGKNEQSIGYVYGVDYFRVSEVVASSLSTYEFENTDLGVIAYHSSNSNPDNHVWTQGGNFSGGNQLLFFGAAVQDYVTVEVNVPKNGYYNINAILCRAGDFGIVQHYIDDVKLGNPINNIEGGLVMAPAVIGDVYLTAGTHTLKAVMIATESSAYPGCLYGLDKLTLQEVIPQNTTSWRVEGENLNVIACTDGIIPTNQKLWWFDSTAWSQGTQLLVKFNADTQSITATFDIKEGGEYNLAVALGKFPDFGKFQFAIDGQNIGDAIDSYNGDVAHSGEVSLGNRYLQSGTHELTITCVGASGSGRLLGLDYLNFNKISD